MLLLGKIPPLKVFWRGFFSPTQAWSYPPSSSFMYRKSECTW
jgi:hypothetical protein